MKCIPLKKRLYAFVSLVAVLAPSLASAQPIDPSTNPTPPPPVVVEKPIPTVRVTFHADDRRAALYRRDDSHRMVIENTSGNGGPWSGDSWQLVCPTPCTMLIPTDATYRVLGSALVPSKPFRLSMNPNGVQLNAKVATDRARTLGNTLVITGAAVGLFGIVWNNQGDRYNDLRVDSSFAIGLGASVVGLGSMVVGAIVLLSANTNVDVRSGSTALPKTALRPSAPTPLLWRF